MQSNESKCNLKGPDRSMKVLRFKDKRLIPRYIKGTINHGGGNCGKDWDYFSGSSGVAPIYRISDIIDRFVSRGILEEKNGSSC